MGRRTIHHGATMGVVLVALLACLPGAAAATATPSPASEQECLQAGLAQPAIANPPVMYNAGIRPLTPGHWHSQSTFGGFHFAAVPESCAPEFVRAVAGQVQMQRQDDRRVWVNLGGRHAHGNIYNPPGNDEGITRVSATPNHAWPDFVFNECSGGKGWLKVRTIVITKVMSVSSHQVLEERSYAFSTKVRGNCKRAQISKRETASYQEERGKGSGRLRLLAEQSQELGLVRSAHPPTPCQSTDSSSPSPEWHMRSFFTAPSVRPGGVARFVTEVAGGNLATFSLEVDAVYRPQKDIEVLARGSRPAWVRTGGDPHWALKGLCHWRDKRRISFLVAVDRQAQAGRLCIPYSVDARTGYSDQPNSYDVSGAKHNCLLVEK
jgi:hypothetical protein